MPALHYRIVTSMWAYFLQAIIDPTLSHQQHGFRPNKSVLSAVRSIVTNWKEYPYRYEFDLTACFNKIELKAIDVVLKGVGIPVEFRNYARWINCTPPKLRRSEVDESEQEIKKYEVEWNGLDGKKLEDYDKIGLPQGLS